MTQDLFNELKEAVIAGIPARAVKVAELVIEEKADPVQAIELGLKAGITVVGEGYAKGDLFLPDLVLSAETLKAASDILEKEIISSGSQRVKHGKVLLGTVKGDLHDIGKTILATLLTSHGFEVIDLGVDVPEEEFLEAVRKENPDVVGLSSLLTVTTKEISGVIQALKTANLRDSVKVIIGGGAVTETFAEEVEADGYGQNAEFGVRRTKFLLGLLDN
jgi:methylmalonyl-CoA mutase cobalamin-binding domain/chain